MRAGLAACLFAGLALADGGRDPADWHDWQRLGDEGDRALAAGRAAQAEQLYGRALALGATLRMTPDLDPHVSRLVASLAAQGKCDVPDTDDHALAGMLALARGDSPVAAMELQRAVDETPWNERCRGTAALETLAVLRWAAGDEPEALALRAKEARCKPLKTDPLDEAATALNGARKSGDEKRWSAAIATVKAKLGPHHPLLAIALERRAALLDAAGAQRQAAEVRGLVAQVRAKPYCAQ